MGVTYFRCRSCGAERGIRDFPGAEPDSEIPMFCEYENRETRHVVLGTL